MDIAPTFSSRLVFPNSAKPFLLLHLVCGYFSHRDPVGSATAWRFEPGLEPEFFVAENIPVLNGRLVYSGSRVSPKDFLKRGKVFLKHIVVFNCLCDVSEGFKEAAEAFAAEADIVLDKTKLNGIDERLAIHTSILAGIELLLFQNCVENTYRGIRVNLF